MTKISKQLYFTLFLLTFVACQSNSPATAPPTTNTPTNGPVGEPTAASTPEAVSDTAAPKTPSSIPNPLLVNTAWDDRTLFAGGLIAGEQSILNQLEGASVYHIDLLIGDDLTSLEGRQEVRYTNQEMEPLSEIYFRLFPNLLDGRTDVHSVNVNGEMVNPGYELNDSAMKVPLSSPLAPGEQVVVGINYSIDVPTDGGGNYGMFTFTDNVLALAHFYPMIAVYDDEGWNLEIPPTYGDVVYADSSFYLVNVAAPVDLTIVTSGIVIGQEESGNVQIIRVAGGPMRDFYIVAGSDFEMISRQAGEVIVNSYGPTAFQAATTEALAHAVDSLKLFSDQFGPYPYTEFDVVATPNLALGIEYPGIVVIASRLYDPANEFPPPFLTSTVAHEVGHQWFYSLIGNDQLDEPWLDEALTQYATMLYWGSLSGAGGYQGFRDSLVDRWARVDSETIPIGLPVRAYTGLAYGAIVYGRGPLFFEALAETMGQETFDTFLRDYYDTFKWGIATTDSLKQLAETHCQCDLTTLFREWVYEKE